ATLRQFIGLASYFRQFVPGFSQLMKPLYFLTSEKNSFDWQAQHEEIRSKIISVLTNKPVLIIFDPQFPIELHTDASSIGLHGLGCFLVQENEEGTELPVAYIPVKLTKPQRYYSVTELECLAVIKG
ncbi:hypothetical protein KR044_001627, partial [Drosophila immigrans]